MNDPITAAIEAEQARALAKMGAGSRPRRMSRLEALEQIRDEMSEALAYGLGGPEPERDEAIRHVGMPFREMVATLLRLRRGHDARWSTTPEMYARGITSSMSLHSSRALAIACCARRMSRTAADSSVSAGALSRAISAT